MVQFLLKPGGVLGHPELRSSSPAARPSHSHSIHLSDWLAFMHTHYNVCGPASTVLKHTSSQFALLQVRLTIVEQRSGPSG